MQHRECFLRYCAFEAGTCRWGGCSQQGDAQIVAFRRVHRVQCRRSVDAGVDVVVKVCRHGRVVVCGPWVAVVIWEVAAVAGSLRRADRDSVVGFPLDMVDPDL